MNRGHVDQEAARQSDVAGDSRALLTERLFGDLDDDVLAGLQHFGNELRTARGARMASLIAAVLPRATGPAAFATRASARASPAIGSSATRVGTATPAIPTTVAAPPAAR